MKRSVFLTLPYSAVEYLLNALLRRQRQLVLLFCFLTVVVAAYAQITVTRISSPFFELDSNMPGTMGPTAAYVEIKFTNTGGTTYTNLSATMAVSGAGFSLAGGQPATLEVGIGGTLAPGQTDVLYWFVQYPAMHNQTGTFTITMAGSGGPIPAPVVTTVDTRSTISANAGGLIASSMLGPGIFVGQIVYYDVNYTFGNIKAGDYVNMQPAGNPAFNAACYQLVDARITASGIPGINVGDKDRLYYQATANANGSGIPVSVRYFFYVKCAGIGTTTAIPYAATLSGTQFKYSGNYGAGPITFPDPQPSIAITKSVTPTNIPNPAATLPQQITYTVTVSNTSPFPVVFQKITDILPNNPTFQFASIAGGSGITAANSLSIPSAGATGMIMFNSGDFPSGEVITSNRYYLPVGGSISAIYNVTVTAATPYPAAYTNVVNATMGSYTTPNASSTVTLGNLMVSDLEIDKTVSKIRPNYGETITYGLTVRNTGADPATGVQVCDSVPNGIMILTTSPAPTSTTVIGNFTKYCWDNLSVPVNGTVSISYTAKAVQGAGNTFKNYARISDQDQQETDSNPAWGFNVDDLGDMVPDDDEDCIDLMPCVPITFNSNQVMIVSACPGTPITVMITGLSFTGLANIAYDIIPTAGSNITGSSGLVNIAGGKATFFIPGLPAGSYTINTLTLSDPSGCSSTVTGLNLVFSVGDTQPPTITCPPNVMINFDDPIPAVDFNLVIATDNCAPVLTTQEGSDVRTEGVCPVDYTLTRTFKATDPAGLTATCVQVISVKAPPPPTVTANNSSICAGGSIDLATLVTSSGGGTVTFHSSLANANAGTTLPSSTVTVTTATNFYIRSTDSNGCFSVIGVTITIKPVVCGTITVSGPN